VSFVTTKPWSGYILDEFTARLNRTGLSLRIVADELSVSHTLLSLVLSGRRQTEPLAIFDPRHCQLIAVLDVPDFYRVAEGHVFL
jgi:hypothetical protein